MGDFILNTILWTLALYGLFEIIKTIIKEEVGFKEFQYTFFKKKDKWVIDIETGK